MRLFHLLLVSLVLCLVSCGGNSTPVDENVSLPKGDPAFPPLTTSWVIDQAHVLSPEIISQGDAICQKLKEDGLAEVVVLTQFGVKQPQDYATHYGRWLKLGKKGMSVEGGNNGIVWLIRPDADERVTISVGRGLPYFTSVDYSKIMKEAADYLNFNNFNQAVMIIIAGTDQFLRSRAKK